MKLRAPGSTWEGVNSFMGVALQIAHFAVEPPAQPVPQAVSPVVGGGGRGDPAIVKNPILGPASGWLPSSMSRLCHMKTDGIT